MLARLGMGEIIVIAIVALLIFGPQKLPELARNLGETIRSFKDEVRYDDKTSTNNEKDLSD